ncbi:MAG: hypothetical protein ACYDAR_02875 [Thermomicrobiales bacterium]
MRTCVGAGRCADGPPRDRVNYPKLATATAADERVKEDSCDNFGIFAPRLMQQMKEDRERAKTELHRATAPIRDEAERVLAGIFHTPAAGPTNPLDGCEGQQAGDDEDALCARSRCWYVRVLGVRLAWAGILRADRPPRFPSRWRFPMSAQEPLRYGINNQSLFAS